MATEFFLSLGYNSTLFTPQTVETAFTQKWATREFGLTSDKAVTVTQILNNVTRWNARRKPELLNSTTYSLVNYREYDTPVNSFQASD